MIALGTGLFSVLRGTSTNSFGDTIDAATVVQSGVPMALMPASQAATRTVDDRAQEVEYFRGRAPWGTDIRVTDRILDEAAGTIYLVTGAHQATNPILAQDLAVDLERTPTS